MKIIKNYYKFFLIIICCGFLFYKFNNSYFEIKNKIEFSVFEILFLIINSIIYFNLLNIRAFLITKSLASYDYSYYDWSKLYFESLILNSIISYSGTIYRATQLKKRNINYTEFVFIAYLLLGAYISITFLLISFEILFIKKTFADVYLILLSVLILIIFLFSLTSLEYLIKFFFKFKIFFKFAGFFYNCNKIIKKIYSKKTTTITLYLSTLIIHIFEIIIFYLMCDIFLDNIDIETIVIFFALNFIVDRTPFISEIPGLSEIILGFLALPLGFLFEDGAIIKLSIRLVNYVSILSGGGLYFILSYFDKNKFVNKDIKKAPVAQ